MCKILQLFPQVSVWQQRKQSNELSNFSIAEKQRKKQEEEAEIDFYVVLKNFSFIGGVVFMYLLKPVLLC